jgi:uncharacterized protein YegL
MNNLRILLAMTFAVGILSCSKNDKENDPCPRNSNEQFVLTIQEEFTTLPSKVSVFFKVDDKDGMPVAGLLGSHFTIYEKGRNDVCEREISPFESNADISSRKQIFSHHTVLVLDLSASVTSTSLVELKEAAKGFINEVMPAAADPSFRMGIWWFDGEDMLHELMPSTTNKTFLLGAIDGITSNMSDDPSTDLYGAVIKSAAKAEALLSAGESNNVISAVSVVIFTDGTDQAGRHLKADALNAVDKASKNIRFFSIGLGGEIDEDVLKKIGKHSFAFANNQTELNASFQKVAEIVSAEANSYYLFEYCSPKRDGSGVNDLRIEAEFEGKIGSVLTKFNATGFTGGCQ